MAKQPLEVLNDYDLGTMLLTEINFNPIMYKRLFIIKCGMKLLIHFQTSMVHPLEFKNEYK